LPRCRITEYGRPRTGRVEGEGIGYRYGKTGCRDLWKEIAGKLEGWGVLPEVEVKGKDGEPVCGVEWLSARMPPLTLPSLPRRPSRLPGNDF
jgi:hypothetical protein